MFQRLPAEHPLGLEIAAPGGGGGDAVFRASSQVAPALAGQHVDVDWLRVCTHLGLPACPLQGLDVPAAGSSAPGRPEQGIVERTLRAGSCAPGHAGAAGLMGASIPSHTRPAWYNDWRRVPVPALQEFRPVLPVSVIVPCCARPEELARTLAALEGPDLPAGTVRGGGGRRGFTGTAATTALDAAGRESGAAGGSRLRGGTGAQHGRGARQRTTCCCFSMTTCCRRRTGWRRTRAGTTALPDALTLGPAHPRIDGRHGRRGDTEAPGYA